MLIKPGLDIVVTITHNACDHVLKKVLKMSTYRLQMFLVKYEHLRSLQLCEDQGILESLETCLRDKVLSSSLVLTISNKKDFEDFEATTEGEKFYAVELSASRVNKQLFKGSLQRFFY